jgi:aspartyl protease family protein
MAEVDPTKKMAKVFVWLAWIIALALLMFLFQDVLDEQYNPNSRPEMRLSESGQAEVILAQNRQGHYVARGTINETPVTFLLDTGATQVSIPAHFAEQFGLVAQGNYRVQTANGSITVY